MAILSRIMNQIEENTYVAETQKYGKSLYAKSDLKAGELVFVASGPLVKKPTIYTIPIDWELWLDPTRPDEGNPARYLCHSCEPNLGVHERTMFVAMRDINKGEEVTIDYAMIVPEYGEEFANIEGVCGCDKPSCRGKLGSYLGLSDELKKKYQGYVSDFLLEKK